jgi:hypothetical protein
MSARRQVGEADSELLDEVDARAKELGQTRRTFVERALRWALEETEGADGQAAA